MSLSFASVDPTKMELSPCKVTFNSVDLGGSLGNVVISSKYMKSEIKADQFGQTVLDRRVSGVEVMVTTELAEIQNKDVWKAVFPHATLITSGANKALQFDSAIGDGDLSNSHQLSLHPLSKDVSDVSTDHTFFKACASAESTFELSPTAQAKLKIVWHVLPDTGVSPARFYRYGDTTI